MESLVDTCGSDKWGMACGRLQQAAAKRGSSKTEAAELLARGAVAS
jgi:hypothetical protein